MGARGCLFYSSKEPWNVHNWCCDLVVVRQPKTASQSFGGLLHCTQPFLPTPLRDADARCGRAMRTPMFPRRGISSGVGVRPCEGKATPL